MTPAEVLPLAISLGLAALLGYVLREVPKTVGRGILRFCTSELEIRQPDLVLLVDELVAARTSGRLRQIDRQTPEGEFAPGRGWHVLRHSGSWLVVKRGIDETGGGKETDLAALLKSPVATTWCLGGPGPLDALVNAARQRRTEKEVASYRYVQGVYRDWTPLPSHQAGGWASVILPPDLDRIPELCRAFLAASVRYRQLGENWRLGLLFWGPPGSGKTKAAAALAQELGVRLYVLNVGRSYLDDADVELLLRAVEPRSVVVLDDLDRQNLDATDRADGSSNVTRAGLLAALESPAAEGRILIITANEPEKLKPKKTNGDRDTALLRPGRVDHRFFFGDATADQARRLFIRHFPGDQGGAEYFAAEASGRPMAELCQELLQLGTDQSLAQTTAVVDPAR